MRLRKFSFSEHAGQPQEWILTEAEFGTVNLVVGRNSSGKTRLLNVIDALARLISGKQKPSWVSANFHAVFDHDSKEYSYELALVGGQVVSEKFSVEGDVLLERGRDGTGNIIAVELDQRIRFQTPPDQVAASNRRDSIQHPFLEPLTQWGFGVRHYLFGSQFGKDRALLLQEVAKDEVSENEERTIDPHEVAEQYKKGFRSFGETFNKAILDDMAAVGYPCVEVGLGPAEEVAKGPPIAVLFVQEEDLNARTTQITMSQGMFRVLALAIQLNYTLLSGNKNESVLIDDIGEGLDYGRSTCLIELLIDRAKKAEFQLFMTTNDRFVMNGVPLEYWSVLERHGSKVDMINKASSPERFKDFEFLGLSNFDFFSKGFYRGEEPAQ